MTNYCIRLDRYNPFTRVNTLYRLVHTNLRCTALHSIFIGITGLNSYDYESSDLTYKIDCIENRVSENTKVKRWEI